MFGISGVSRDLPCFPLEHHSLRTVSFASQYLASRVRATKVWTPKAFVDYFSSVGSCFLEKHLLHFKWFLNALGFLRILSAKWSEKSFIGHRPQPFVIHRVNPLYSPGEHCVQYLRLTDTLLNASFSGFVFPQAWHTNVASASESCAHCLHVQDSTVCLRSKASCAVYVANKKYLGMLRLLNMQATWKKHANMQTCKQANFI